MPYSQISALKLLSFIARRGKGHTEVINSFRVLTFDNVEPEKFLPFFVDVGKQVFYKETLVEIAEKIVNELHLSSVQLTSSFTLLTDKLSPTYTSSAILPLPCEYLVYCKEGKMDVSMKIECPVRISHISTLVGNLVLEIINPAPNIYFEDILDTIHKFGEVVIYPICSLQDVEVLQNVIDSGKKAGEYLEVIKDGCCKSKISESGRAFVYFTDLYNVVNIERGVEW